MKDNSSSKVQFMHDLSVEEANILSFILDNISGEEELDIPVDEFTQIGLNDLAKIEDSVINLEQCTVKIDGPISKSFNVFSSIQSDNDAEKFYFKLSEEGSEYKDLILKYIDQ